MAPISGAHVRGITLHQCVYRSAVMLGWQEAEIPSAGVECEFNCNPRRGQATKVGGTLYPHSPWWRTLCIRLNINLLNQRSMCLPRVCPLLVTAPFLWLQHVCGTVCRPLSHRRHRCWHSGDDSRRNCLLPVIQAVSRGYTWHLFLFFLSLSASLACLFFVILFCKVSSKSLTLRHLNLFV